jgi:sugar lactone lactonase YvrE
MYEATHFLKTQNKLGEGAVWSPQEQAFYWVDIENSCFSRYQLATQGVEMFAVGDMVGALALREAGGLVLATRQGFATWDFQTRKTVYMNNSAVDLSLKRFNDGAVDSKGRFWAGTMPFKLTRQAQGVLYRLDGDGSVHVMETGLFLPNGIGWSPDNTQMYFTDSVARIIYVYDFDAESGTITNRRELISTPDEPGVPDGLTIDDEGFLWSLRWGGAKVTRYDPAGRVVLEIPLPVPHPTSCAFGGADRNELFITSAWTELKEAERLRFSQAGDLFHVQTDITGPARPKFLG